MGKSSSLYSPVQALSCMPITCNSVDLPAPEGPMIETNSPSLISTLMRRKTKVLVGPCSKYFSTLRNWIIKSEVEPLVRGRRPRRLWLQPRSGTRGSGADGGVRPTSKSLPQKLVERRRVRLAAAGFHYLALEEADHRGFSSAVLLHLLGIGGNDFVDDLAERTFVADLR